MEKSLFGVIVRPLLTERSTLMKEKQNQYLFQTSLEATKPEIKRAVEQLFRVRVDRVRTMVVRGKFRRLGRSGACRPDWKKAIVTLPQGQKIDFAEQA